MAIFKTLNSTYEVDLISNRTRRLDGTSFPTVRQGSDGVWKTFVDISPIKLGSSVLITWNVNNNGISKATLTSQVIEIIN